MWKNNEGQPVAFIKGKSCWGVLRGLESFTQLIYSTKENGYLVRGNFTKYLDVTLTPHDGTH